MTEQHDEPSPPDGWLNERLGVLSLAIGVELGFVVVALFLGWLTETPPLPLFHWNASGLLLGVLATLPLLAALFVITRWPIGPLAQLKKFSDTIVRPLLRSCTTIDLLGISVLAGLGEEMLFRGAVQGSLQHIVSVWVAVLASSLLFGILHAVTPTYAVLAALVGAYLGLVWYYTDNLVVVTVAHGLYDFLALLYVLREKAEDASPPSPAAGEKP